LRLMVRSRELPIWNLSRNQIAGDVTIDADAQAAIGRVGHTGTGPGQDRAIRVVKAVRHRAPQVGRTSIDWVPGHTGIAGNDQRARKAASEKRKGRTSIAWLKERVSQHYGMAKDTDADKGKHVIITPATKTVHQIALLEQLPRSGLGPGCAHPT
jgi:hypothetical protein